MVLIDDISDASDGDGLGFFVEDAGGAALFLLVASQCFVQALLMFAIQVESNFDSRHLLSVLIMTFNDSLGAVGGNLTLQLFANTDSLSVSLIIHTVKVYKVRSFERNSFNGTVFLAFFERSLQLS